MKRLERSSHVPGTKLADDVLLALSMAIALSLAGATAWIWSTR